MKKRKGLLALLGIGALAFWKYKKMTPEEQDKVKGQINDAKRKFTDAGQDLKTSVEDKLQKAKTTVSGKVDELKNDGTLS